jgi:phosphotransferase system HPr-like phosphotransfer protein
VQKIVLILLVPLFKTAVTAGPLFTTYSPVKLFCIGMKHGQQAAIQMSGSFERKILQKIFGTVEVNGISSIQ